jgi:small-conductance mechanosensitive channel
MTTSPPRRLATGRARGTWSVELEPGRRTDLLMTVEPSIGGRRRARRRPGTAAAELDRASVEWSASCTSIESDNKLFNGLIERAMHDLRALIMSATGGQIVSAGIPWYVAAFGRDALVTAGEASLLNQDLSLDALRVLARVQATDDDPWRDAEPGKILHELRVGELARAGIVPHTPYYGIVDALFLIRAADYYRWRGDLETLRGLRPALDAALAWLDEYGDCDGDGFVEYQRRSPGGLQNQGWKDAGSSSQASAAAERPMAPDMFCGWGVRTLSSKCPAFNPMSYHNGSVWPHDNSIIAAGLKRYGHGKAVMKIAGALFDVATGVREFRLPELSCGFDRSERTSVVAYPVACIPPSLGGGGAVPASAGDARHVSGRPGPRPADRPADAARLARADPPSRPPRRQRDRDAGLRARRSGDRVRAARAGRERQRDDGSRRIGGARALGVVGSRPLRYSWACSRVPCRGNRTCEPGLARNARWVRGFFGLRVVARHDALSDDRAYGRLMSVVFAAIQSASERATTTDFDAVVRFLVDKPLTILGILVGAVIVGRLARRLVNALVRRWGRSRARRAPGLMRRHAPASLLDTGELASARGTQRIEALAAALAGATMFLVWVVAVLLVLRVLGVRIGALLTGAGLVGVALGFGAQSLIKDFISGVFILVEDQFGVGDWVDLGAASGSVEAVTLRSTRLRSVDCTVWHVPNGQIQRAGNMSQHWSRALLDVQIALDSDIDRAREAMKRVADEMWREDGAIIEEPEVWGVQSLGPGGITIRLVAKTKPLEQWRVSRLLRERIKAEFDREGIEVPPPTPWTAAALPAVGDPHPLAG